MLCPKYCIDCGKPKKTKSGLRCTGCANTFKYHSKWTEEEDMLLRAFIFYRDQVKKILSKINNNHSFAARTKRIFLLRNNHPKDVCATTLARYKL